MTATVGPKTAVRGPIAAVVGPTTSCHMGLALFQILFNMSEYYVDSLHLLNATACTPSVSRQTGPGICEICCLLTVCLANALLYAYGTKILD